MVYEHRNLSVPVDEIISNVFQFYLSDYSQKVCALKNLSLDAQSRGFSSFSASIKDPLPFFSLCLENNIDVIINLWTEDLKDAHSIVLTGIDDHGIYTNDPLFTAKKGMNRFISAASLFQRMQSRPDTLIPMSNTVTIIYDESKFSLEDLTLAHGSKSHCMSIPSLLIPHLSFVLCSKHDYWMPL